MSDIQTGLMLEKGSAQVAMNALQFPAVDKSHDCKGFGDIPDYMAFNFECLKCMTSYFLAFNCFVDSLKYKLHINKHSQMYENI
jgi:hypothetical protein